MKRSLLSLALATAMLLTAVFSVVGMQAFAAEDINLLKEDGTAVSQEGCTFEYVDGALVITSTTDNSGIGIAVNETYDPSVYPNTLVQIDATVPFTFAMYDGLNGKWMTSAGDFFPDFNTSAEQPAPAGQYDLSLFTLGCFTWDGSPAPAQAQITSIYIEPKGAGTVTVNKIALNDGIVPEPVEETITYTVESKESAPLKAGDTFTLEVSASAMSVSAIDLKLQYDATSLKAVSGEVCGWLAEFPLKSNNVEPAWTVNNDATIGEIFITGVHNEAVEAAEGEVFATITFEALVDISEDVVISGISSQTNVDGNWVTNAEIVAGGLTIVAQEGLLGDVNLDGEVTGADVVMLRRFVADLADLDDQQLANANVNGDDDVTGADVVMLRRFVAELIDHLG